MLIFSCERCSARRACSCSRAAALVCLLGQHLLSLLYRFFHLFCLFGSGGVFIRSLLHPLLQYCLLRCRLFQTLCVLLSQILFLFQLCLCGDLFRFCPAAPLLEFFHLLFQLRRLCLRLLKSRCRRLLLLFQRLYLTGKRRQFRTACQHTAGTHCRTAGERTACIDDLSVQRHNAEPVLIRLCQCRCAVQILCHSHTAPAKNWTTPEKRWS